MLVTGGIVEVVVLLCLFSGFKLALCYSCFIGGLLQRSSGSFPARLVDGVIVVLFSLVRLGCFDAFNCALVFFSLHHSHKIIF